MEFFFSISTWGRWQEEFKDAAAKLNVKIAFEAVGGQVAGAIVKNMPPKSTIYSYGLLSGQDICDINPHSLVFQGKTLRGFWLTQVLQQVQVPFPHPYTITVRD